MTVNQKLKVGFLLTDPSETSSFYRALGPFGHLEKQGLIDITIIDPGQLVTWPDITRLHWLFIMRPHHQSHYDIMMRAKSFGVKTWVDLDDDLFHVPENHKDWETWQMDHVREVAEECIKNAHVVSVTTKVLADSLMHLRTEIEVIPNAIDDFIWPTPTPFRTELNSRVVTWRGGASHEDDVALVADDLEKMFKELDLRFIFMGYRPKCLYRKLTKGAFSHIGWMGHERVFEIMRKQRAHFHICPLEDHQLSRAKSNIAFLESVWFGASLCFVSQVTGTEDHWEGAAIIKPDQTWFDAFKTFVERKVEVVLWDLRTRHARSIKIIQDKFLLSKVNERRKEILFR